MNWPDDYTMLDPKANNNPPPVTDTPVYNQFIRCPLPQISTISYPDNLRQFYRSGVPQTRIVTPGL